MWQTLIVVLAVALAGWYVFRRLRRTVGSGQNGACTCGGPEGPCPSPEASGPQPPSICQDCTQRPQSGADRPEGPLPKD